MTLQNVLDLERCLDSNNKIIRNIKDVDKITELHLHALNLESIPEWIGYFSNIKKLYLQDNYILDMKRFLKLDNLRNMETLNLSGNIRLLKIEGLDNCLKLIDLNISYNKIEKIENIEHLKLNMIWLKYNQIETIEGLDKIINNPDLLL